MKMKIEIKSKSLPKVCSTCEKLDSCVRPSKLVRQCYQRWYNRTQRDPQAEKQRQAQYRQTKFDRSICSRIKTQARKSGLEFTLTPGWFKKQLNKGVCAATGLRFQMPKYTPGARGKRGPWTPSVDRIDNTKGYTAGNCQLVVWMYNLAKSDYSEKDVARLSMALAGKAIAERFEGKKSSIRSFAEGMHQGAIDAKGI